MAEQRWEHGEIYFLPEYNCRAVPASILRPGAFGDHDGAFYRAEVPEWFSLGTPPGALPCANRAAVEKLSRYLVAATIHERATELGTPNLDWAPQGSEHLIDLAVKFAEAHADPPPRHPEDILLGDLAQLLPELERPGGVFVAPAKPTALALARRLLRRGGWEIFPKNLPQWQGGCAVIDPHQPNAAVLYFRLLMTWWGWSGHKEDPGQEEQELAQAVTLPARMLDHLARRCA